MRKKLILIGSLCLILVLASLPFMTACPAPAPPVEEEEGPPAEEEAPKPEGTLVIALETLHEESFLPDIGGGGNCQWWEIIYDHLLYTNMKTREPIPGLAKRWEYSKDYLTLTVWLREGVPWQEGWGEVTAEDVKYTFERCFAEGSTNSLAGEGAKVESIEIIDRYTLAFHLNTVDPVFWRNLTITTNPYGPIICKEYVETVGDDEAQEAPIGSGPYRLVEHKSGDYMKFEALEEHWRIVPEFKYLIIRSVPEESTRVAMLTTGVIDVSPVSADKVTALLGEVEKAGLGVHIWPGGYIAHLVFGAMHIPEDDRYIEGVSRQDPWGDKRVREAMNIAIDRKAIVENMYYEGCAVAAGVDMTAPGWDEVKPIPYDPERAKRLLAEADYQGFSFKLCVTPKVPGIELGKVTEAVAAYWEAIGLKPEIVLGDWGVFRPKVVKGDTGGWMWLLRESIPDDWTSKLLANHLPGGTLAHFQSAELLALGEKLTAEMDWQKRDAIWREICSYERDNYINVFLVIANQVWAVSKEVGEWPANITIKPSNFVYIRHAKPLDTWRLFTP